MVKVEYPFTCKKCGRKAKFGDYNLCALCLQPEDNLYLGPYDLCPTCSLDWYACKCDKAQRGQVV